jgi:hypothetical protein
MLVALRRTVATLGVLLLAACPAPADLDADVASLDYGEVAVGSSLALPIGLTNVGENKATVSFRIDNSVFVLGLGGAIEVLPGGSRVVHFYAEPTTVGPVTGTLTIAWNATDTLTIPMSVTGIDAGADDADADGYTADVDCDDSDPEVNPGADEVCDAIDNNCEGGIDEGFDVDEDTYTTCGADGTVGTGDDDCLDSNSSVNPGAEELCNGEDDDCNDIIDDGDFDDDNDGADDCTGGDCDDSDPTVRPGALELCDGLDNDCDDAIDEIFPDVDVDGVSECTDCDDTDNANFPGNIETCDGQDNDCDCDSDTNNDGTLCGEGDDGVDENAIDSDNDGVGCLDCDDDNDEVFPGAPQICDAVLDNDCDTVVDANEFDSDTDGLSPCGGDCDDNDIDANLNDVDGDGVDTCGPDGIAGSGDEDCDDNDIDVLPGAIEVCNAIDDNCDTVTDEGFDFDLDFVTSCGPDGIAGNADDDCDDLDINAYPGAPEACGGGTDLNCDSVLPDPCGGDDCADILATNPTSPSGTYTVDPAGNGVGFDAYCDMTTDSGGWTMVLRTTDDGLANAALAAAGSYASIHDDFVPSTGYDPNLGTPVRVPAQYWDDFALVGEVMVREVLLKADGTNCTPLHHSAAGTLSVPAVAVGLNVVWTMSGTDPNDVLNGTQAGAFPILQTTDRYTVAGNCVGGNGSAPWFMGTCNGGLMPASGAGFWTAAEPRPVVYFDRVDDGGTDLNGSDFATACGGAAMMNPPASALGPASAWYTHSSVEYYFR